MLNQTRLASSNVPATPGSRALRRTSFRRVSPVFLFLVLMFTLALPGAALAYPRAQSSPLASASPVDTPTPADLFMQSVVIDDGALGWKQLCAATQAQVPESALVQAANAEHNATAKGGLKLTSDFLGKRPRSTGGELRVYIVTGRWSDGTIQLVTYSISTQASGCVEDVKHD